MANHEQISILRLGTDAWNRWRLDNPEVQIDLRQTDFMALNLHEVNLSKADLSGADLQESDLHRANLSYTNLTATNLRAANLTEANLMNAHLVETNLEDANLTGSRVFGIAAWNLQLDSTIQSNLVITPINEPIITVDNLEIAQFIYLILNNHKLREVIDSLNSKTVLILGRFSSERKLLLDAMRQELRKRNYIPILFDFEKPATRSFGETISILANLARFIIVDFTVPSSIPYELLAILNSVVVPVQPIIEVTTSPYTMLSDFQRYPWILPLIQYQSSGELIAAIEKIVEPAEMKLKEFDIIRKSTQ